MQDAIIFMFVVGFAIVIIIVVMGVIGAKPSPVARQSRTPTLRRTPPKSAAAVPIEDMLSVVALGLMGFAAYKFIQSGGLRRLNAEIGKLPVNVNGQRMSIASAIREDSYFEQLVKNAIERKIREVFEGGRPIETLTGQTPKAATDIALMLQEAIDARIRREGL